MNRIARIAPALVLSALVVGGATAGSAVAAKLVTGADIKNGTVASVDIKNGDVKQKDLGATVKAKLNGTPGYQVVTSSVEVPTAGQDTVFVGCPAGKVALGGGGSWDDSALETDAQIVQSAPQKQIGEFFDEVAAGEKATAWEVTGRHNNLDAQTLTAYVICAKG